MKKMKRIAAVCILVVMILGLGLIVKLKIDEHNRNITNNIGQEEQQIKIDSNISITDSDVTRCRQIDAQLSSELKSGNYTWKKPLVVQNPYQNSPLTAIVLFQTEEKTSVKATVLGDDSWEGSDFAGETSLTTEHRVPVLGLYAGKTNQVLLEMFDENGKKTKEQTIEIKTDSLPEQMENLVDVYESGEDTAMPYTLVTGQRTYHSFVFDKQGEIRWYLTDTSGSYGIFPISGGRFMFQDRNIMVPTYEKPHTTKMYEMDYLGRTHKIYYLEKGWHHEVIEKEPGGNLLVLSSSIDEHVEDVVLELDRKTGEVVKSLDMREIFQTEYEDQIDWAHLNSIDYDKKEESLILSPRNLHSVIKVDWKTNELKWILGNPEFWDETEYADKVLQPEGDIIWHYQQHAAYQIEDNDEDPNTIQVMLFDNHWDKTRDVDFFDENTKSFVTQYTIDEKNKTVTQDHLYGGVKSKITSNFVLKKEDNRVFSMGGYLDPTIDDHQAMIYEFTYDTEEVVNQYALANTFYRAYEFVPDYVALEKEMNQIEQANFGTLKGFAKVGSITTPEKQLEEELEMRIMDGILYIRATDHAIHEVYLKGNKKNYKMDLTSTLPGEDIYEDVYYYLSLPLNGLEVGTYELILNYKGEMTGTGKTITIEK